MFDNCEYCVILLCYLASWLFHTWKAALPDVWRFHCFRCSTTVSSAGSAACFYHMKHQYTTSLLLMHVLVLLQHLITEMDVAEYKTFFPLQTCTSSGWKNLETWPTNCKMTTGSMSLWRNLQVFSRNLQVFSGNLQVFSRNLQVFYVSSVWLGLLRKGDISWILPKNVSDSDSHSTSLVLSAQTSRSDFRFCDI